VSAIRRQRPEQQVHRAVVAHLRARGVTGLVAIHVPNGGLRSRVEAKILQGLGVTAGVPDLLLWHAGKSYALELKAEGGRASDAQVQMLTRLKDAGVLTAVGTGIDNAIAILEGWQLLRGKAQTRLHDNADNLAASAMPRG
jgi:hypothetical protein